jgi:hypothetical protein
VAPAGTEVTRLEALQLVTVAAAPLNVTVLLPCDDPKLIPVIVTGAPTAPEAEERLVIVGAVEDIAANAIPACPQADRE